MKSINPLAVWSIALMLGLTGLQPIHAADKIVPIEQVSTKEDLMKVGFFSSLKDKIKSDIGKIKAVVDKVKLTTRHAADKLKEATKKLALSAQKAARLAAEAANKAAEAAKKAVEIAKKAAKLAKDAAKVVVPIAIKIGKVVEPIAIGIGKKIAPKETEQAVEFGNSLKPGAMKIINKVLESGQEQPLQKGAK